MRHSVFVLVFLAAACATGGAPGPALLVKVYDVTDLVGGPTSAPRIHAVELAQIVRDAAGIDAQREHVHADGRRRLVARASVASQARIRQVLADVRRHHSRSTGRVPIESLTNDEAKQVHAVLEQLYRSFGHGKGGEPDWDSMRSVFVDGAQFVAEPAAGKAPKPQSVDEFVASWQASIRESSSPTVATEESILDKRVVKVGRLIRVDVLFRAKKGTDAAPRKAGLDSLTLVEVGSEWKVLSFVVHYESKP